MRKDFIEQILREKQKQQVLILAHYYVSPEVQEIADKVGDSYFLSKEATKADQDKIIMCGVSFMGESVKLLNPGKQVYLPAPEADCAMAHMAQCEEIKRMRELYEDLAVVCYVNSTVELKSCSDVCVTSANAVEVVKNLPNKRIYFVPDQNLGSYVKEQVPEKEIILCQGYCPIHAAITVEDVRKAKERHKDALFLVHPECRKEILQEADYIGSTSGILKFAAQTDAKELLIGTETGIFCQMEKDCPQKKWYPVKEDQICQDMKKITLEQVWDILNGKGQEVKLSEEIIQKAKKPLEEMLRLAAQGAKK